MHPDVCVCVCSTYTSSVHLQLWYVFACAERSINLSTVFSIFIHAIQAWTVGRFGKMPLWKNAEEEKKPKPKKRNIKIRTKFITSLRRLHQNGTQTSALIRNKCRSDEYDGDSAFFFFLVASEFSASFSSVLVWVSMWYGKPSFIFNACMCPDHVTESDLFGLWHICKTMRNSMFFIWKHWKTKNTERIWTYGSSERTKHSSRKFIGEHGKICRKKTHIFRIKRLAFILSGPFRMNVESYMRRHNNFFFRTDSEWKNPKNGKEGKNESRPINKSFVWIIVCVWWELVVTSDASDAVSGRNKIYFIIHHSKRVVRKMKRL